MRQLGVEDGEFFARHYDVTPAGNFEGHNILNRLVPPPRGTTTKRGSQRCAKNFSASATRAYGPASTTRCSPTGTG